MNARVKGAEAAPRTPLLKIVDTLQILSCSLVSLESNPASQSRDKLGPFAIVAQPTNRNRESFANRISRSHDKKTLKISNCS